MFSIFASVQRLKVTDLWNSLPLDLGALAQEVFLNNLVLCCLRYCQMLVGDPLSWVEATLGSRNVTK